MSQSNEIFYFQFPQQNYEMEGEEPSMNEEAPPEEESQPAAAADDSKTDAEEQKEVAEEKPETEAAEEQAAPTEDKPEATEPQDKPEAAEPQEKAEAGEPTAEPAEEQAAPTEDKPETAEEKVEATEPVEEQAAPTEEKLEAAEEKAEAEEEQAVAAEQAVEVAEKTEAAEEKKEVEEKKEITEQSGQSPAPAEVEKDAETNPEREPPHRTIPQAWQSQESNLVLVKFLVLPDGFSHVKQYPSDIPAVYMYSQLEKDLCVDKSTIHISWEGRPFQETDILNEVANIPDSGLLILHLQFDDLPRHLQILSVGEMTSGTRNVVINYGEGIPSKSYVVTLVIAFDKKPFIGGFRHKKTDVHYHHAVAQTDPLCKEERARCDKVSRDTQTRGITRTVQTVRECGTQMAHSGHIVSTDDDKVFYSRPYFTSQQVCHYSHVLRL